MKHFRLFFWFTILNPVLGLTKLGRAKLLRTSAALLSLPAVVALSMALLLTACGGNGSGASTPPPNTANQWTWMSGSKVVNATGVYGTQGVASVQNVPGARFGAVSWTDSKGNFWLFGGTCCENPLSSSVFFNDLWEFSPAAKTWTWVSGSDTVNAIGVYGTQGVASASNVPGARIGAVGWIDSSGILWLFGGLGSDSTGSWGENNDLWMFNPSAGTWTWVSGSDTANNPGVFGTQGVPSASNEPTSRDSAASWIDSSGNFWLFGGLECPQFCLHYGLEDLNDLWEFNPTSKEWTWVSGGAGYYGYGPGSRDSAASWIDSAGNLWLFGGNGWGLANDVGLLNDLWEYDPTAKTWTWVSGSSSAYAAGVYGTLGVASAANVPGARSGAVSWIDSSGVLWLFGGTEELASGDWASLNDLWSFNPAVKEWTWVSGSNAINAVGIYGAQGVASIDNIPGARSSPVSWIDSNGNFWLFGGGYGASLPVTFTFNDVWRYQP